METVGQHSRPIDGTVTANGHALVPLAVPSPLQQRGATSVLPRQRDDPGQARTPADEPERHRPRWPLFVIAAPAAVAIWSGWVGLGEKCGFGPVRPLPGIAPGLVINTAITLPVGVEAYGAYALHVWLAASGISARTRMWARNSAVGALALGCLGQVAFHLLAAAGWVTAPWPVVTAVSCLPVVTLALAAALAHMIRADPGDDTCQDSGTVQSAVQPQVDTPVDKRMDRPPPRKSTPGRTALDKAAAAIGRHPDWTDAAVAKSLGVSTKTVQRARNARSTP